jgi:hypothetical protein
LFLTWTNDRATVGETLGAVRPELAAMSQLGPFIGWEQAFKRYNGGHDPQYWDKIQSAYRDIKNGGQ